MTQYPTDLTEKQWQVIKNILEPQARNRKHPLKEIMNAILYINKTGASGVCFLLTSPLGKPSITTSASGSLEVCLKR
jgi:transposase